MSLVALSRRRLGHLRFVAPLVLRGRVVIFLRLVDFDRGESLKRCAEGCGEGKFEGGIEKEALEDESSVCGRHCLWLLLRILRLLEG